ncbi:hypothetical protein HDU76_001802 [Blyttiomyces sp. JEL0837]|nr:hypothetical protein HDU76_001802 [Blyttiomyces sp. JEL0837]
MIATNLNENLTDGASAVGPNIGTDSSDFFESDRDLAIRQARAQKMTKTDLQKAGNPIKVTSKVLAFLLLSNPFGNESSVEEGKDKEKNGDEAGSVYAFVGESGHVARKMNLTTGKSIRLYKGHTGPVTSLTVQYSSNGKDEFLYTGSWDKTIRKWSVETGETLLTFTGHSDFIKTIMLHGKTLYSGSSDKTIRKWDVDSGTSQATWKGHTRPVEALVLSFSEDGDGHFIYSASSDTTIRKWDPVSGACLGTLAGHLTSVYGLLLGDGELWSVSADKTAKRWSIENGKHDITLEHPDFVKSVALFGPYVITGSRDENIRVWDISTEKCVRVIEGHFDEISCMDIHNGRLWTGSLDGTIRSWDLTDIGKGGELEKMLSKAMDLKADDSKADEKSGLAVGAGGKGVMTAEEERELEELMMSDEDE